MAGSNELNWDDLRYFLRALEHKSLAGAARMMGVQHTTIGRRLAVLERTLGAPVVLRGPDGLSLTPLGQELEPLVKDVERAVRAVLDAAARERSRVRLAVPSGFPRMFSAHLAKLREEHPELSLELTSGAKPADLKKGEADLALRSGRVSDPELVARKLCLSGFSLYAGERYLARCDRPVEIEDLSGHDVIGYGEGFSSAAHVKWLEARTGGANVVLRSREMTDIVSAASNGVGLAVLPCWLGDNEPSLVRVTPEVVASVPLSLVYRRESRLSAPVRAVVDFVVYVVKQNEANLGGRGTKRR